VRRQKKEHHLQAVYILDKSERFATSRLTRPSAGCHHRESMSKPRKTKKKARTCDDCFFRCKGLCALDLAEPCSTFRQDRPEGLVPPRQPSLLPRDPDAIDLAAGRLTQTA
jgi:hypothetical protein